MLSFRVLLKTQPLKTAPPPPPDAGDRQPISLRAVLYNKSTRALGPRAQNLKRTDPRNPKSFL